MQIENWNINNVKPYENNPRKNDEAVEYVANSIREFGFQQPLVVDSDGVIVVGHTRYKAAQSIGLNEIPVIVADELTDNQIEAYRLADNKVSEFSIWDTNKLNEELEAIDWLDIDMTEFGFYLDFEDESKDQDADIPFANVLGAENNYIVLKFDTDIDWINAKEVFRLKDEKRLSTRKDGAISKGMEAKGIGRVIDGVRVIQMITGE